MINQNYAGADGAGDVFRLSLLALVMVAAGIGLWKWADKQDAASTKPALILAGQTR